MRILFFLITILALSSTTSAADFNVNTNLDLADVNPGDSICEATIGMSDCSLRAAILESNALQGSNQINLPAGTYELSHSTI
ncbi:MAG: hypothetical protein ACWA5R_13310 [bacterium]